MSFPQEDLELDTIERCPHDSDNPYVMVRNALIREPSLTPNCRWLLTFLLSNDKGWKIKPKQIINHLDPHMKKDSVYKIINEAIAAGYMRKEEIRNKGMFGGFKYFISETPKFKKSLPQLVLPDAVLPEPVESTLKKEQEIKNENVLKNDQSHALSLSLCEEPKQEREKASQKEIEFREGRFQNISMEQMDAWKRAYPNENIEAYIAQFEAVLNLNPRRISSKTPWGARLNSWIRTQSLNREIFKVDQTITEEIAKEEIKEPEETSYFYHSTALRFIEEWSEKLGMKGIISYCSNVFSLKIHSSNQSWSIPIYEKGIEKFFKFAEDKIKKEIEIPQT